MQLIIQYFQWKETVKKYFKTLKDELTLKTKVYVRGVDN